MSEAEPGTKLALVGLGAGTHAKSVLDAIHSSETYEVVAVADDDPARAASDVLGVDVVHPDVIERLQRAGVRHAFVGVGGIGDNMPRRRVFDRLAALGLELPTIAHARAVVSPFAELGRGVHVLAGAVVNAGAIIEDNVIVNTGAIVEHDCWIAADVHISPGVRLAGLTSVGEGAHVGIGAVVIEGVRIGAGALVAAGAVVLRDVPDGARVAGVPARPIESRTAIESS